MWRVWAFAVPSDDELAGHAGKRLALGEKLQHLALAWREAPAGGYFRATVGNAAVLVVFCGALP